VEVEQSSEAEGREGRHNEAQEGHTNELDKAGVLPKAAINTMTTEAAEAVEEDGDLAGEITTSHNAIEIRLLTSGQTG
jgi:hypothetical protein